MYDVIYLGSGHACWHGAVTLSAAGKKVAILDHDVAGGTCTNYGCDAKILLDGPFEFVEGLERYKGICVDNAGDIDWKKLMEYKADFLLGAVGLLFAQAIQFIFIGIIFSQIPDLRGWTFEQILFIYGFSQKRDHRS